MESPGEGKDSDTREWVHQRDLLKVRGPGGRSALGVALSQWGGAGGFAGIWHCCREERQKTLDGRSPSFSKTGIITHWAAETIWWNAGPVLRKRTLLRKLTLCQFMGILSAVIVPPGLRN